MNITFHQIRLLLSQNIHIFGIKSQGIYSAGYNAAGSHRGEKCPQVGMSQAPADSSHTPTSVSSAEVDSGDGTTHGFRK